MNGLSSVILAATPLALMVLYFALSSQQQVRTDLERQDVKQQIESEKFDLEFEQLSRELEGEELSAEILAVREARITELQAKGAVLDERFDADFEKAEQEINELKTVIEQAQ